MARRHRAPFVALVRLLHQRYPELEDPRAAVVAGLVVVDGRTIANPAARVRRDATVRVMTPRSLRGEGKLATALDAFDLDVSGAVAVDVGAAAGGFTAALLRRGATRVFAVDVGHGQLRGTLRGDPRVVNLERTNVGSLDALLVPEVVDLVTIDVSYLSIADAVQALDGLRLAPTAQLVALVKPTFELRAHALVVDPVRVRIAIQSAVEAIEHSRWRAVACTVPAVTGAGGAIEAFVLAISNPRQTGPMQFSAELRDRVADGTITVSYRLWSRAKVKVGGVYQSGSVMIEVDDVELLPFSSITDEDLARTGEPDLETLRRRAAHAGPIDDDTVLHRVEFHVVGERDA